MSFRITGLSPEPFRHLYGLSDAALAKHGACRRVATETPGFPDRIEMRDARIGESLLLVNHTHHDVAGPYRSNYAVYVLEGAETPYDAVDKVPDVLARRLLSLRGFSAEGILLKADVLEGSVLKGAVDTFFDDPDIAYLHAHNAKPGCFAARIDRA